MSFVWTDDAIATVTRLWGSPDHSAAIVARLIDAPSRNAVIGKAKRLGLSRPHPEWRGIPKPRQRRVRGPNYRPPGIPKLKNVAPERVRKPSLVWSAPPPSPRNIPLIDLGPTECRWPLWDNNASTGFFCGSGTYLAHPYCGYHCSLAFSRTNLGEAAE